MSTALAMQITPAGGLVQSARLLFVAVASSSALALVACGGAPALSRAEGGCLEQITLSLNPGFRRTGSLIKDLESDTAVQLKYLRSTGPNLFVYQLSARGRDPQCANALARLNRDSRVRFAEPDVRRRHYDAVK
jgi:hypothetical protein